MKKKYTEFMNSIAPEKSNNELFNAVIQKSERKECKIKMTEKKILKKAVMIPIAAAAALTLSVAGGAAIYSGLSYLRNSELAQSAEVAESIQTEVFTDSSEHVKITVEEYVSDGLTAYATVKYEALDDYGKEWLSDYSFTKGYDSSKFALKPCTLEYGSDFGGVSHSFGRTEIEELKTETERYFMLTLNCNSDAYDGEIAFCYIMNNYDFREVQFEKYTVETKSFTLSSEEQVSEYFTPTHLKISDLSFVVYGENHGAYDSITLPNYSSIWSTLPEGENERIDDTLNPVIVKTNGERIELSKGSLLGSSTPLDDNFNTDLVVCSGDYSRYDFDKEKWVYHTINSEGIAGIELCGVYFEAEPIE